MPRRLRACACRWTVEKAREGEGGGYVQLTLAKADESIGWDVSLAAPGGTFECWTAEELWDE